MTRKLLIIFLLLAVLLLAGSGWVYSLYGMPAAFTVTTLAKTSARPFADGAEIRLSGVTMYGTVEADPFGLTRFVITDCQNDLAVEYAGTLPAGFREGRTIMLTGILGIDNIFHARKLRPYRRENCDPATIEPPIPSQQAQ